jgi:hypothetical protein
MLFYITGGAPQAVPGTACVEANRTACIEDTCSSDQTRSPGLTGYSDLSLLLPVRRDLGT